MFRVVLCFAVLASFSARGAGDAGECRAGACDDRPACPQSPCRCLFPSGADCALYYECVRGKPRQHRCSPGLLFDADALTCDYDYKVNCSIGKTTRTAESSTVVISTVTVSAAPDTTATNTSSKSPGTSTSFEDASTNYSTEIYDTTASNKDGSTDASTSESSDLSIGTANTKYTGEDDTTTSNSSTKTTETSEVSTNTTFSKPSDFPTEITNPIFTTEWTEEPQTTKYTSTTEEDESNGTVSPVSITEESVTPDTFSLVSLDEENEEPETTNPSSKENEISETISSASTAEEIKHTETTISTVKSSDEPETTSSSSETKENGISETTSSLLTTKEVKVTETTISTTKSSEVPETTNPSFRTKDIEVSETTIFTAKNTDEPETTSPSSGTKKNEIPETSSIPTTVEIEDTKTTIFTTESREVQETTYPSSRTKDIEVSETTSSISTTVDIKDTETTIFTSKSSDEPETTSFSSGTNDIEVSETTSSTPTTEDIKQTSSGSTIPTISETGSANDVTKVTENSSSTELPPEVTTSILGQNWTCPSRFGLYPDESDCNKFYHCSHWKPYRKGCPSNLHFDPDLKVCDWPERAGCDAYTSIETTRSTTNEGTTVQEVSTPISNSVETDSVDEETTTVEAFTTYKDEISSELNSFSTSRTTSTKPEDTTSPFPPSTARTEKDDNSSFSTISEETNDIEDFSTHQTTVSDEDDITTTLSPQTSMVTADTSYSHEISTGESNITEKITAIPTTTSMPSESDPTSSNQDFISSHSTKLETSSDSFNTETDIPYSSTKTSTTEAINANASTSTPASSSFPDETTDNSVDVSTKRLITETEPASSNQDIISAQSTSDSFSTQTTLTYSSTEASTTTEVIITTEIKANISTTTGAGSPFPDETTTISADYTDASTEKLTTTITSSTEISQLPFTENSTAMTGLTESSTSTASKITDGYQTSTSQDASNATLSTTEAGANSSFVCPSRFGLYPDPDSCLRFYHCSHGIAHQKRCPSGLHFNPELQVCDWPYRAGCGEFPVGSTPGTIQAKEDEDIFEESCECECCFYPNKTDCSRYTLCLGGVPHGGRCAQGLLFDPLSGNCDLAERVICLGGCQGPNGLYPHPEQCAAFYKCVEGRPSLQHCPEGEHFKAADGRCADPCDAGCDKTLSCNGVPPTCTETDALLPTPGDCSSYYQCAEGHAYFVKCPDGTHFNAEYGVCEPPCDAKCDPTIECPLPVQRVARSIPTLPCSQPTGLFPARDCGSFHLCVGRRAHLLPCPPGLHYNAEDRTCDTPCNARCDKSIDCAVSKSKEPRQSLPVSLPLPLWLQCKILGNGRLTNPKNCSSFFACSEGGARVVPCPSGLHFDPEHKECKSPCLAGCDASIQCSLEIPVPRGKCSCKNCHLPVATDCSAFLFCGRGSLTKGYCPRGTLFDRSSGRCKDASRVVCEAIGDPAMCLTPSGSFSYPGDCSKFIQCEDSVALVKDCENGLEFDPEIRACVNPKGHCDSAAKDPLCVETTGQFAHPENSSLFYQCENGVKFLKSCSPPLVYNAWDQVCDWPHNVRDTSVEETLQTRGSEDETAGNGPASPTFQNAGIPRHRGGAPCHVVPGVTCPCACRVTTYDDCDSFYQCRGDGRACERRCPEGLFFNRRSMVCDLPQNVECRDFFFATLRRLKSGQSVAKYPLQSAHLSRAS